MIDRISQELNGLKKYAPWTQGAMHRRNILIRWWLEDINDEDYGCNTAESQSFKNVRSEYLGIVLVIYLLSNKLVA